MSKSALMGILISACVGLMVRPAVAQITVPVFDQVGIQLGGNAGWKAQQNVSIIEGGRAVETVIALPPLGDYSRVTASLQIGAQSDPWDRAGNIQIITPDGPVELQRFITGSGGSTSHQQDVTNLIPYLRNGQIRIRAFIDTWLQQAWTLSLSLKADNVPQHAPSWNLQVFNDQDWRAEEFANNRRSSAVTIPSGLERVTLSLITTGHASDGSGGDEFTPRVNRVLVDGVEVFRQTPWRTDGVNFRGVNPRSGRWGEVWSSDLPRSGWIPGDDVEPYVIDLTDHLTPGQHNIQYEIQGIEGDGGDGYGYWRVSSYLTGFASLVEDLPGDFNRNGTVDAADYTLWRNTLGQMGPNLAADRTGNRGNPDGIVNQHDYDLWKARFGRTNAVSTNSTNQIPEPLTIAQAIIIGGILAFSRSTVLIVERWSNPG